MLINSVESRSLPDATSNGVTSRTSGDSITAEQIATIGKRIGSNAVLSYERSLTSAENI